MHAVGVFERAVSKNADRLFAFDRNRRVTYAQAEERARSVALHLRRGGIEPGDAVGLCSRDRMELLLAILGTWYVGALPALIDAHTSEEDLPYFLSNIGPKLVIAEQGQHARLKSAAANELLDVEQLGMLNGPISPEHDEDSHLYLSYTSGTTGDPKGAVLQSGPVTLGTSCIADRLGLRRDDILLATTPTSSSFQLVAALLPAMHVGAAVGLVAGSTTQEIRDMAMRNQATVLVAYPLTLSDVVNAPGAAIDRPFRLALSGGSPLAPRIKRDYRELLGIQLIESYGESEFGGFMALGRVIDEDVDDGSVGPPLPDRLAFVAGPGNNELPVGKVGEVVVPTGYFKGYWNEPKETERTLAGGFLHCGDLAVSDTDGRLKVMGRTREAERALKRGTFLRELEDAYYEHPAVQHAVVVEDGAGLVRAFVELRAEHQASEEELARAAAERCDLKAASTQLVRRMPRTFSGKADRRTLASPARV